MWDKIFARRVTQQVQNIGIVYLSCWIASSQLFGEAVMSIYTPCVLVVQCFFFVCCIYGVWKAKRKTPLDDLPGPPPESFLLGKNPFRISGTYCG